MMDRSDDGGADDGSFPDTRTPTAAVFLIQRYAGNLPDDAPVEPRFWYGIHSFHYYYY